MDLIGAALSTFTNVFFLTLVATGVVKAFQIANTLNEVKELLGDIKRNTQSNGLPGPLSPAQMTSESADNLLRAVAELDQPIQPSSIELGRRS